MPKTLVEWSANNHMNYSHDFKKVEDLIDKMMEDPTNKGVENTSNEFLSPPCEVEEEELKYVFKFDLPGVLKDQIKIELCGTQLIVTASRVEDVDSIGRRKEVSELLYGTYLRSFNLPFPVEEKQIKAKIENGVLSIFVSKSECNKAIEIPIS